MSEFYDLLNEYIGEQDDVTDIRAVVRMLWFYDFDGYPLRLWQGKGKLHTADGNTWLGTVDARGVDHHTTPVVKDGRDGSSVKATFGLKLIDTPGITASQHYEAVKQDKWRVYKRKITGYRAIFKIDEGLRPSTPIIFFKEYEMMHPNFSEKMEVVNGAFVKKYTTSIIAKDGNFGRSEIPNGTYANAIQVERAKQLGVSVDRGCEYVAALANRTYIIP